MEQEIAGHRKFEVESRLLKDDAEHCQSRYRIAQHVLAHDLDTAGIGHEQAGKQLEERCLAGTIGPSSAMNSPANALRLTPSTARIDP